MIVEFPLWGERKRGGRHCRPSSQGFAAPCHGTAFVAGGATGAVAKGWSRLLPLTSGATRPLTLVPGALPLSDGFELPSPHAHSSTLSVAAQPNKPLRKT